MFNYNALSQVAYVNFLVNTISTEEGHLSQVTDLKDSQITIGYGYTFGRNDNVAIWSAAGISLSTMEWQQLADIDAAATLTQKNSLAVQFSRAITKSEAIDLLKQTYPKYESPALNLGMPFSKERAAFVSLAYNRGIGAAAE